MQNLNKILLLLVAVAFFSVSGMAASFGGLNIVSENRTFYYDNTAPFVNITTPLNDTIINSATINFIANITDKNESKKCFYSVDTSAGVAELPATGFNCSSDSFIVSASKAYTLYVNATDGKFWSAKAVNFTALIPAGGGSSSGGGGAGGGDTILNIISGNFSAVILFDTKYIPITVIAPPSKSQKDVIIRNAGNKDMISAEIVLSSNIDPYIDVTFCSLDGSVCNSTVNLDAGESGLLRISGDFPENIPPTNGVIKIVGEETFEIVVSIQRLVAYKYFDPQINFFSQWVKKNIAIWIVTFYHVLFLIFIGRELSKK